MKEEHFNSGQLSETFVKVNVCFINITVGGGVQLPNYLNILLKTQIYPLINQRITPFWSSSHPNMSYIFFFTQYLQWLTTKSFLTFSLSNISKLNLNQNTNLNHNFKINQTRKKKKEKKIEEDKANLTHLSCSGEANKRWWGRGQACVNIRRRSLCV